MRVPLAHRILFCSRAAARRRGGGCPASPVSAGGRILVCAISRVILADVLACALSDAAFAQMPPRRGAPVRPHNWLRTSSRRPTPRR